MATPSEKLATSLEVLHELQARVVIAIRSKDLTRTHRERLLENGFLQEVMKGWYIASRPDEGRGDSTAWYASFWDFCAAYLNERFGAEWCLSPNSLPALSKRGSRASLRRRSHENTGYRPQRSLPMWQWEKIQEMLPGKG